MTWACQQTAELHNDIRQYRYHTALFLDIIY